jgi:cyclopropane fatty-acyl-phospholipid synthase-like methyltransferase
MSDQMKYFYEIYGTLPRAGPGDKASTSKAYNMIPNIPDKPKILDIGCGPGEQTLELARLSKGTVIALDNHQPFLDKVKTDAKAAGLSEYIKFLKQDMNTMVLEPKSFDLIWSEGALYFMGFETGLKKCRELLKNDGYISVTELVWLKDDPPPEAKEWAQEYEAMKNVPDNLELFKKNSFEVIGHFTLPNSSWLDHYYNPMQVRIDELRPKYGGNEVAMEIIEAAQDEINGFIKNSDYFGYEFFVAKKGEIK